MLKRRTFLHLLAATTAVIALPGCVGRDPQDDLPPPFVPITLTKAPWAHLLSPTSAVLRFETREDLPIPLLIEVDRPGAAPAEPVRAAAEIGLPWGLEASDNPTDDEGEHVLHELVITGLTPGARVTWRLETADGLVLSGSFRASPTPDTPVRIAWIADTMFPASADVAAALAAREPDLIVHGGDIQYRTHPADTWNGFFVAMAPLFSRAAAHLCFGNHELDEPEEAAMFYDRLFARQGGREARYHAVTYGGLRILCLDSETGALDDADSAQVAWARQDLAAAREAGLIPILAFHRPTYTLSKYGPRGLAARQVVHDLATTYGVPLVLAGHVHGYERFVVDGVTYVIDGGGGALLTNLDERRDEIADARPGEPELRLFDRTAFGGTVLDFDGDAIRLERISRDGDTHELVEIPLGPR